MSRSKHTPGPWIVDGRIIRTEGTGSWRIVADLGDPKGQLPTTMAANSHLIAAAPEMLEALERLLANDRLMNAMEREQARLILDAVAKARGDK